MLTLVSTGENQCADFIKERVQSADRFENPIKRDKISNFASNGFKKRNKSKTVAKTKTKTRELFESLLYLVAEDQIDLRIALSYPLLPIPPCMTHADGSMRTTNKATVMEDFTGKKVQSSPPDGIDNAGMFIIRSLSKRLPRTLRELAQYVLIKVMKLARHRVDLVFDTYKSPSIKDAK